MENVNIQLRDMPPKIRGFTVPYYDESCGEVWYTVFLNSTLNDERQRMAWEHEAEHIEQMDFESLLPMEFIEALRHGA